MIVFIRRLRDCTSGAALMETVIVFPLVLTLMFGVLDIARAIQDYHTSDKSMRSAARYLSRVPAEGICGWGWDNAQNLALYGTIDPPVGARPLIVGWTAGTLSLKRDPDCADPVDDPMTVVIEADVPIPTPLISAIGMPSTINVRVRHEERHIGG